MKKTITWLGILIVVFIAGGLSQRYWTSVQTKTTSTQQKDREVLYWVAPMDANYRRDKPGKSLMGMDLIPVYADAQSNGNNTIKISPLVEQNLGVKTATVKQEDLSRVITTVGTVTVNENNIEHIHTYTDGWIKVLSVKTTGELVHKNQLLFELFSPALVNAQEEYLLALKNKNSALIRAGKKKLITLGLADKQIQELHQTRRVTSRVKFYAPQNGIVSKLNVREGNFVKPDTDIMTIENLSTIWMIADVFERQANWVSKGQSAIATLPYIPGKTWQGKVDYVYPQLDKKTHTLRVRLVFPNPDFTMKPNMYATIKILSQPIKNVITIPRSALIRTGDGDRVIVAVGNGRYKAQPVTIGIESGDHYQILSGLKPGDSVVTSAQFLIDSESNLKASFNRMQNHRDTQPQDAISNLPQEFVGMGRIMAVNLEKNTLSLDHKPIPAINMPAMKMVFAVAKDVDLSQIKTDDEIHFVMVKQADNLYLITTVRVMKQHSSSH